MDDYKTLAELQEIDSHIDALDYREANLAERDTYLALRDEVAKVEALYANVAKKLREEAALLKKHEDVLEGLNAKIAKEEKRLYSGTVTIPKELASIQRELAHLKVQADNTELELLEQSEVVDGSKSDDKAISERLQKRTAERDAARRRMEDELARIAGERDGWRAKREPVYTALSEDARRLYDKVRLKHRVAVTVLAGEICQGCRVDLPSTEADHIHESTALERCSNCGRIFVKPTE
ncbi:MAG: hypothetical protein KGZ93_07860 [Actinobacteria bacterium]|nr:hypothetical protein [Actinomycetota bacterium]